MEPLVRKRSGKVVPFSRFRIINAVYKAMKATKIGTKADAERIADAVSVILYRTYFKKGDIPHVETIQDIIEKTLMEKGFPEVAKAYILYREKRRQAREISKALVDGINLIEEYLGQEDWRVKENSNMSFSLQGLNFHVSSSIVARYWLEKLYPEEVARAHKEGDFHIHDLGILGPYTYYGKEVVIAKYKGKLLTISFEKLYELLKEEEYILDSKDSAYAKRPDDLYVLDKDGWVKVTRITKKRKDKPMRFIKNRGGRSVIVTEDHPMITENGEKPASEVKTEEDKLYTVDLKKLLSKEKLFSIDKIDLLEEIKKENSFFKERIYFNGLPVDEFPPSADEDGILHTLSFNSPRFIKLTEDLGYFVGFVLAESYFSYDEDAPRCISVVQKELSTLIALNNKLKTCGFLGCITQKGNFYELRVKNPFLRFLFEKVFKIELGARNKSLPVEILSYSLPFVKGLVAGIIDGDGSINTCETTLSIRMAGRTLLEGLAVVLSLLGFTPRDRNIEGQGQECTKVSSKVWHDEDKDTWHKVINNEPVEIPDEWIYDITTESGTLIVNGMWNHNCVGWDLYDLLIRGFGGVSGKVESKPAKHFRSALGQIVNFFYTLQGECYSADTQVLTDKGWKYFWEVNKDDYIVTLNPETNEIELQKPVRFFEYDYDGELYHFKSKKLDLLVTPNHNMFVQQYCPKCKKGLYYKKFVKACEFNPNVHFIPKGGKWRGVKRDYFILPGIKVFYYRHFLNPFKDLNFYSFATPSEKSCKVLSNLHVALKYETVYIPELKIPMNDWLKFFGIWLAEGSITLRERKTKERKKAYYEYQVRICQNKGKTAEEIEGVLKTLPFNYTKKEKGKKIEFTIYNKQLFLYLKQFGKAEDKFIPQEIKNLAKDQLEILFEWMMKRDGYTGNGNIDYYTKSKKLADDIQEIALKLGYSANIYEKRKGKFKWYRVAILKTKYFKLSKENIKKVRYKGKVYCLEVPNHVLYVRRNGKACWCGNSAGAQAFSNFDTLLAPFVRYDKLSYEDVKQCMQEFLFNVNVPTRVGFQCLSEDTEILTPSGWKSWNEVEEGDLIYTFNLEKKTIEIKKVTYVFKKHYEGIMYNLKNCNQDQLISPGHRVVREVFNTDKFVLQPIEELLSFESPIAVPVSGENSNEDYPVSDDELKLIAWILSEGSIEKDGSKRVSIYQSKEKYSENYEEIIHLIKKLNLEYTEREDFWGKCIHIRLSPKSSKFVHAIIGNPKKVFPKFLYQLSKRQAQLFLETYAKGDGWIDGGRIKIITTDKDFANGLMAVGVLAGFNVSQREREPEGNTKKLRYELTFTKTKTDYIQKIEEVPYSGIIWSVHTENETVIARRAGQVFITGNTPFTNLTFDLKPSKLYAKANVIIGGKPRDEVYEEFHKEMSMINRAFCELMMEGDAKGRIFTFPIPTYNITKDFDWDNPDYEPLWEMTRKYGIPYFANFVNSDMDPDDARSMCCRLRLDQRELRKRGGGLFGANPLTGSIGVVTINLPRLGYLSTCEEEFFERLEALMELAKTSLEIKRKVIEDFTEKGLYPYSKVYLQSVKEARGQYWANHFSTIGVVGMNEMCLNFLGKPIYEKDAKEFAIKVLKFMREKIADFQQETGNLYNLEATPAEGTSYRLAKIDKKKFPRIKTSGTDEAPYYTNSCHLPVNYTDDIFEILTHQDDLQVLFTGGTVVHLFVGEEITDRNIVKELIKTIVENFRLPYFSITPTFSVCPVHGYLPGKHEFCPYPHTEEELEKFGIEVELPVTLLTKLPEKAYKPSTTS